MRLLPPLALLCLTSLTYAREAPTASIQRQPTAMEPAPQTLPAKTFKSKSQTEPLNKEALKELIKRGVCQLRSFMHGKHNLISEQTFKEAKAVVFMESFSAGVIAAGFKTSRGFAVFLKEGKPLQQPPLFLRERSLSLGPQFGAKQANRIWLLMDDTAVDQLKKSKFKVGNDYGAVIGTAGKDQTGHFEGRSRSQPSGDKEHPSSYFYSTAQGLCAGARIEACRLKHWKDANALALKSEPSAKGPQLAAAPSLQRCTQEAFLSLSPSPHSWHTARRTE